MTSLQEILKESENGSEISAVQISNVSAATQQNLILDPIFLRLVIGGVLTQEFIKISTKPTFVLVERFKKC